MLVNVLASAGVPSASSSLQVHHLGTEQQGAGPHHSRNVLDPCCSIDGGGLEDCRADDGHASSRQEVLKGLSRHETGCDAQDSLYIACRCAEKIDV